MPGDRGFESISLQRRVRCEPDFLDRGAENIAERDSVTEEIREMMDRLIGNLRAAAAVFMTEDPRQLLGEKEVFREIETRTTEEYFGRARTRCRDRSFLRWHPDETENSARRPGNPGDAGQ
jgi:hypothetical protein